MCGGAQTNIDFYTGVLGLRLIKVGVNQDDPGTYHFFYGDGLGGYSEGITFFPFADLPKGVVGRGQAAVVAYAVPADSLDKWAERLASHGVETTRTQSPFSPAERIDFTDPDGLRLRLVASEADSRTTENGFEGHGPDTAIRGFHSVELWSNRPESTIRVLEALGASVVSERGTLVRLAFGQGFASQIVDVESDDSLPVGRPGAGTNHHVAWRTTDETDLQARRTDALGVGLRPTDVIDRMYFKSVYFREYGGILFELATNGPGFDVDEPADLLGRGLSLPPWLEDRREEILAGVEPINLPGGVHIP